MVIQNNPTNNTWLNYRSQLGIGDPQYVEHVFSYIKDKKITILDNNGNPTSINLNNQIKNSKQL